MDCSTKDAEPGLIILFFVKAYLVSWDTCRQYMVLAICMLATGDGRLLS